MEIPYYFFRQFQNKNFYYTCLTTWSIDKWQHVFYQKKDGKVFTFDSLSGGVKIKNVNIFTDDYMIAVVSPEEILSYEKILPSNEFDKIKNIKDDDNLCLMKFYFK